MTIRWADPAPTLVVNDETGEFVMTHNITRVMDDLEDGSRVYVRSDTTTGDLSCVESMIESPLSPKELHKRLYNCED